MCLNNGLIAYSDDLLHRTSREMTERFPGGEGCFAPAKYDLCHPDRMILFTGGHHSGHFYAVGEMLFDLGNCEKSVEWLLTCNITYGIAFGMIAHVVISLFCGDAKKIKGSTWVITALFIAMLLLTH